MSDTARHEAGSSNGGTATMQHPHPNSERDWADLATGDDERSWRSRTRIVLTPTAAPSIMGLTGFFLATIVVGSWQAGWYGTDTTGFVLWPLALMAGGVLQSVAAVASFRARDGLAVAVHTAWGSFWVGFGILQVLVQTGVASPIAFGDTSPAFGFWFLGLALVTLSCAAAALGSNLGIFTTLSALAGGAGITAAGFWAGSLITTEIGGWFFVVSAVLAWIVMTSLILENSFGRTILPLGGLSKAENIPGREASRPMEYAGGMPGSKVGQ